MKCNFLTENEINILVVYVQVVQVTDEATGIIIAILEQRSKQKNQYIHVPVNKQKWFQEKDLLALSLQVALFDVFPTLATTTVLDQLIFILTLLLLLALLILYGC